MIFHRIVVVNDADAGSRSLLFIFDDEEVFVVVGLLAILLPSSSVVVVTVSGGGSVEGGPAGLDVRGVVGVEGGAELLFDGGLELGERAVSSLVALPQ